MVLFKIQKGKLNGICHKNNEEKPLAYHGDLRLFREFFAVSVHKIVSPVFFEFIKDENRDLQGLPVALKAPEIKYQ
jgi:hypothetical protein